MKKFFITIMMLLFLNIQTVIAGETIIIGFDNTPRYEKVNKNNEVKQITQEDIACAPQVLQEIILTTNNGQSRYLYFNRKGKLKKISKSNIKNSDSDISSIANMLDKEFQTYLKHTPRIILGYVSILNMVSLRRMASINRNFNTIDTLNGEYVIHYSDEPISVEYNNDGTFAGFVKVSTISESNMRVTKVFEEYRLDSGIEGVGLNNIMFLDIDKKKKYVAQYVYDVMGNLIFRQINNEIFVARSNTNNFRMLSKGYINRVLSKIENNEDYMGIDMKEICNNTAFGFGAIGFASIGYIAGIPLAISTLPMKQPVIYSMGKDF